MTIQYRGDSYADWTDEGHFRARECAEAQIEADMKSQCNQDEDGVDRSHYRQGDIEPIEVIEDWDLGFNLGNAVKYIARAEHKNSREEDIKKSIWYLERELSKGNK